MYIYDISGSSGIDPVKDSTPRPVEPSKQQSTKPDAYKSAGDRTDVNRETQIDSRNLQAAKLVLDTIPDVRTDKVELARQRLRDGYYDGPEIRESIAARMVKDPEANPVPTDVDEIRNRLQNGYYDNPEVKDVIVKGMLNDALKK